MDSVRLIAAAQGVGEQSPFFERFLVSPGFAGARALIAAIVALIAGNRRLSLDRDEGQRNRAQASQLAAAARAHAVDDAARARRDELEDDRALRERELASRDSERWWKTLDWTLDHLETLDADRATILLETLEGMATTDTELALVFATIGMLQVEGGGDDSDGSR